MGFSLTDSLDEVEGYIDHILRVKDAFSVPMVLVGYGENREMREYLTCNRLKCDVVTQRSPKIREKALEIAKKYTIPYLETRYLMLVRLTPGFCLLPFALHYLFCFLTV